MLSARYQSTSSRSRNAPKRPGKGDRGEIDIVVQEAADAVEAILREGIAAAMNRYNTRSEPTT